MEHRRGKRLLISNTVSIKSQNTQLGEFTVNNISNGGLNILDSKHLLSKGDFIKLKFYGEHMSMSSRYTKALVVYRHKMNVGLMLVEDRSYLMNLVKNIVKTAA